MRRLFKHLLHTLWLTVALIIVLYAVTLSLARLAAPFLITQKEMIQQWAGKVLQKPVDIKALSITWHDLQPVLQGQEVIIYNSTKTHPLFKVNHLEIEFNILQSLLTGYLQLNRIDIDGARLKIHQKNDNTFVISGIKELTIESNNQEDSAVLTEFVTWLFKQTEIALNNIDFTWENKYGRQFVTHDLDIVLRNQGEIHTLLGEASLQQKIPTRLQIGLVVKGDWQSQKDLSARFYLSGKNVDLTQWFHKSVLEKVIFKQGVAGFAVWGHWQHQHLTQVQTVAVLDKASMILPTKKNPLLIEHMRGNFLWQPTTEGWVLDARLQHLAIPRWEKMPGIKNFNGYLHVMPESGFVDIASADTTIDFDKLFAAPLFLKQLTGHMSWEKQTDGWLIKAENILADTVDVHANTDIALWLPQDKSSPTISLLTGFKVDSAQNIGLYLPLTILQPDLVKWLDTSIKQGQATGSFVLQGKLSDFPFDQSTGTFIIDTDVSNATLAYEKEWPVIKELDANVVFAERGMQINASKGKILETPIKHVSAVIPELSSHVPIVLQINGNIQSDLAEGLHFINASPLREKLGNLRDLRLSGPMQLQLALAIPLDDDNKKTTTINGLVTTQEALLSVPDKPIKLEKLQGKISFTQDEISAPDLTAILWNKPIQLNLSSNPKTNIKINYGDLIAKLMPQKTGWLVQIQNSNMPAEIFIPKQKQQALNVNFKRLYLTEGNQENIDDWKPTELPRVNLSCADLRYKNMQLGRVQTQLIPIIKGVRINNFAMNSTTANLQANGSWQFIKNKHLTNLQGQLISPNIGATLAAWGLPAGIQSQTGKIQFDLEWWNTPYNPHFKEINGKLKLDFKKGQINDIGSSASAKMNFGRLLTSLSLQSLGKRLQLDFSDLKQKGFDFDVLKGELKLQNGNAITNNLFLDGPVALVALSGRIGLATQDYDLRLTVTPHFTSSLPVIIGLAGGPIAGAATWLVNKMIGSEVQKIAASTYRMTGPWQQPEIQKIN